MTTRVAADEELLIRDLLRDKITATNTNAGCTLAVPSDWTPGSKPHLTVASDGSPAGVWPIVAWPTVRVVARAADATASKALANIAMSWLLDHDGTDGVSQIRRLVGVMPAHDPETRHDLAWFTVRCGIRTTTV